MIEKEYLDRIEKLELQAKLLSTEIDLLRRRLGKVNLEENECKRWRAKPKEYYCYVHCIGNIYDNCENHEVQDNFRYSIGNYFKTREEAEEYKENLITKQKLKDLALRLNENQEFNWSDCDQYKYFIDFCHEENCLKQYNNITLQSLGQIYCLDINFLDIAKQKIGEEALIKLIKSGV